MLFILSIQSIYKQIVVNMCIKTNQKTKKIQKFAILFINLSLIWCQFAVWYEADKLALRIRHTKWLYNERKETNIRMRNDINDCRNGFVFYFEYNFVFFILFVLIENGFKSIKWNQEFV